MGGTLAAIEAGFQQRQIQESAYRVQQAIERGDLVVVGVNRYRRRGRRNARRSSGIDPDAERRQVEAVQRVRAERDPVTLGGALRRLDGRGTGDGQPPAGR